jgi:hypothetical protein
MRSAFVLLLSLCVSAAALAQSAQSMQKQLDAEAEKLKSWSSDPILIAAVKAQNAKRVPLTNIKSMDAQWSAGNASGLVQQVTIGACADHLRKLTSRSAAYGETFLMDNQGALVCSTGKTSDYWQGDEAKWQRAWNDGKGFVFIDRPRYDESSARNVAQISVPIVENGHAIGVITIGVALK